MIITVTGPIENSQLGRAAAHEHVMVDFHAPDQLPRGYNADEVVSVIEPHLVKLRDSGCQGFVDCTPIWLGRDPQVLRELSLRTGMKILTNTGWYQAPMIPPQAYALTAEEIAAQWIAEAQGGIGDTGIRPGFIKIALNSGRLIEVQIKILRAAILASKATGLAIVSHTVGSEAVLEAVSVMEREQFSLERFIWAHADAGDGREAQLELARKGVWLSLDGIGDRHDAHVSELCSLIEAGYADKVLISQDSGWYNVGEPQGGRVRPYHTLFTEFIPYAVEHGIGSGVLDRIVTENVAQALRVRE